MKTCKKILAGVLVLAMVLSMCAFTVSAEETTETATSVLVSKHSFDGLTVGTQYSQTGSNSKSIAAEADSAAGGAFYLRGKKNDGSATVVAKAEGDNYISSTHRHMGYNHRVTNTNFTNLGYGANFPVLHAQYDIMIPADDAYKTNKRTMSIAVGTTSTEDKTYSSNATTIYAYINNGVITGTADDATATVTGSANYTYGEWVTISAYAWANEESMLNVAVYAGDDLLYLGLDSTVITGMATNAYDFTYHNTKDNSGTLDTYDDTEVDANAITSVTNYDNIIVELLPASSVADFSTSDVAYKRYIDFPADELVTAKASANFTDNEDGSRTVLGGKGGTAIIEDKGTFGVDLLQGKDTVNDTTYSINTENDRTALQIASTGYVFNPQNVRKSFGSYMNDGNTHTFVNSFDVYIPEGTETTSRTLAINMGYDLATSPGRTTTDIKVNANIVGGYIEIGSHTDGIAESVPYEERGEKRSFPSNTWKTINFVYEFTHGADAYSVNIYGIYDNEVIYKEKYVLPYTDFDGDGVSDDMRYGQTSIYVTPLEDNTDEIITLVDSMYFEKNNQFDWSGINTNAWTVGYTTNVGMTKDASGNVTAEVRSYLDDTASGTFVVAVYDANGALQTPVAIVTSMTEGTEYDKFTYTVPAASLSTGSIVKAFLFDTLSSATPLVEHGKIVIE